ncbi:hypothetical protein GUJ93_ZPchr0008g12707 [Zizania palustris]|uniref:Uncharacterized protein n=1 Tax=Zizania palustris TaxID=103762 RepID=A0A8J5RJW9_ZIZPA|nr:hypothetical protein GUJ93_ZPchr0008g12707 [Zizania palustris]
MPSSRHPHSFLFHGSIAPDVPSHGSLPFRRRTQTRYKEPHNPSPFSTQSKGREKLPSYESSSTSSSLVVSNVGPRQGRQGAGKGRREEAQEGAARQYPGHHEAGHPASGQERWREAHLRADLRGDPRRAQDLPGERHPRRRHLHGARPSQNRHRHGRGVRTQETGPHPLRFRRLSHCFWSHLPSVRVSFASAMCRDSGWLADLFLLGQIVGPMDFI